METMLLLPAPARPSLADLFAAAQDHEEALHHMWASEIFEERLVTAFPTLWGSMETEDCHIIGMQWRFVYDGLEFAITWQGYPANCWLFQAWNATKKLIDDTSEGYISAELGDVETALLVFMGAAVAQANSECMESEAA